MMAQEFRRAEADFFRNLNNFIEPLARAGFGWPCLSPTGLIVVETRGRKSGRVYNVPLLASVAGRLMLVSTARRDSQWVKNLAATPEVRYWLGGRPWRATAYVFSPSVGKPEDLPAPINDLAAALTPLAALFGVSFTILAPRA